jgi:hypothetical protein
VAAVFVAGEVVEVAGLVDVATGDVEASLVEDAAGEVDALLLVEDAMEMPDVVVEVGTALDDEMSALLTYAFRR